MEGNRNEEQEKGAEIRAILSFRDRSRRKMEGPMEYNKEQQEVLIQDFIDMLFVQRNLSSNTLYAYKNDLQNFSRWLERRHYGDINDRSIYEYFFICRMR